eukprot:SAG11_NODE_7369_length_1155_cov_1.123106_1_plen_230_part_00
MSPYVVQTISLIDHLPTMSVLQPLHHWYEASIFADVMSTCGGKGDCYIRNDGIRPFAGRIVLNVTDFQSGRVRTVLDQALQLAAGAGVIQWIHSSAVAAIDGRKEVLEAVVTTTAGIEDGAAAVVVSRNVVPFATPGDMQLPDAKLTVTASRDPTDGSFVAEVRGDAVAMYATLTTLAQGRFATNAFLFHPPMQRIRFVGIAAPHGGSDFEVFAASLRVEDVSCYWVEV